MDCFSFSVDDMIYRNVSALQKCQTLTGSSFSHVRHFAAWSDCVLNICVFRARWLVQSLLTKMSTELTGCSKMKITVVALVWTFFSFLNKSWIEEKLEDVSPLIQRASSVLFFYFIIASQAGAMWLLWAFLNNWQLLRNLLRRGTAYFLILQYLLSDFSIQYHDLCKP